MNFNAKFAQIISMRTAPFLFALLLAGVSTFGQIVKKSDENNDVKLTALPYYSYGKGLGLTSPDSIFQLNIRFRMQNRATYYEMEDEKPTYDAQVRRLRLRFDGYVGNPKFLYAIQLSFAPGDVGELEEGDNINIIRDAAFFYRPNDRWEFTFGQTKLPGNRQRVNSSGALQLTDRTINNARFNLDRDFGLQINNKFESDDKFSYNLKGAISTGQGRNFSDRDDGVALTGKAELYPLGAFRKGGTYFEGDIQRESKPKFMLSGAYHQNNLATRTQGTLGEEMFAPRTFRSFFADAVFKYNGWAAMAAFMSRSTNQDPVTVNPDEPAEIQYAFTGSGFDYQASYIFPSNYEIIGRYSLQKVHHDIHDFVPHTKQYSLGLTKYFWEHAFKLQGEVTYDMLDYASGDSKGNWYIRFQVEIGI
jgi:phosphate-selective porin OprO/OprP